MREIIDQLKNKPEKHRKQISVFASAFITLIIAGGYFGFEYRSSLAGEKNVISQETGIVSENTQSINFKSPARNIALAFSEIGDGFSKVMISLVKNINYLISNDAEYVQPVESVEIKELEEMLDIEYSSTTFSATSSQKVE